MQKKNVKKINIYKSNYIPQENHNTYSKNPNINVLLNRIKINKKKEIINKITLLGLTCIAFLIIGLITF